MKNNQIWIAGAVIIVLLVGFIFLKKSGQPTNVNVVEGQVEEEAAVTINRSAIAAEPNVGKLYQEAQEAVKDGNLDKAKEIYRQIETEHPDSDNIAQIQNEMENVNMQILFSNRLSPDKVTYEVANGDSLGKIAKKFGTTIELIKKSNNLKSDIIRIGQKLNIWTAKFNIFVDKSQNTLMVKKGDEVFKIYTVSTGADNSTPVGEFVIINKLENPVWFNNGIVVPPDSPTNELGSRWLGFDIPGYGIHGTIKPETIGSQATAGCVRMLNREVEELYSFIPVGTKVKVVD